VTQNVTVFRLTDVPAHKGFAYADWSPFTGLHVVPSVDFASDRTTMTTSTPPIYYRTGAYANVGLRLSYAVMQGVELSVGARNLFDDQYRLVDGFPEAGRSFYVGARARY